MLILISIFEFILLLFGISLPIAKIDEFWFFSSEFSILSIVKEEGENFSSSKTILYSLSAIQILWQIINKNNQIKLEDSFLLPITGL